MIAFAEYAIATGDEERLARATSLYRLLIRYYQNGELLPPKVYPQTRRAKSHAMPMILLATLLTEVIRSHAHEILTRQDTQTLIDQLKEKSEARDLATPNVDPEEVAKLAKTAIEYPPMQASASMNLDAVKKKIQAAAAGHGR